MSIELLHTQESKSQYTSMFLSIGHYILKKKFCFKRTVIICKLSKLPPSKCMKVWCNSGKVITGLGKCSVSSYSNVHVKFSVRIPAAQIKLLSENTNNRLCSNRIKPLIKLTDLIKKLDLRTEGKKLTL